MLINLVKTNTEKAVKMEFKYNGNLLKAEYMLFRKFRQCLGEKRVIQL